VQAARSVGRNGDMAALYSTFAQAQDTTAAAYRLDAKSGSLSYPGVVVSQA
jgi:6-phosphogluconolactonase (cycloisomerase 2 family)